MDESEAENILFKDFKSVTVTWSWNIIQNLDKYEPSSNIPETFLNKIGTRTKVDWNWKAIQLGNNSEYNM